MTQLTRTPAVSRRSRKQQDPTRSSPETANRELVSLWILRMLVKGGGLNRIAPHGYHLDGDVVEAIGLKEEWADGSRDQLVRQALAEAERREIAWPDDSIGRSVAALRARVGLSDAEAAILRFCILLHADRLLSEAFDVLQSLHTDKVLHLLAQCLLLPIETVREAFGETGRLPSVGLVTIDPCGYMNLQNKIDLLPGLLDAALRSNGCERTLFRRFFDNAPAPLITLDQAQHLEREAAVIRACLESHVREGSRGMNFLIHGLPGTGKTQFVRALCAEAGLELLEVAVENKGGDAHSGDGRFGAYRLAQKVLAGRRDAVILFDEIEDVFRDPLEGYGIDGNRTQMRKAWVNNILENNAVPAFWLSNRISHIDRAFLRRFDFVVEVKVPSRARRAALLRDRLQGLEVTEGWIERAADCSGLAPAHVDRAAAVVRRVVASGHLPAEPALELVLGNALKAQGAELAIRPAAASQLRYDVSLLNPSMDLGKVAEGVRRARTARLCLYGPPGTGKTAFARHLAEQLDQPVMVVRASDVLSPFVGESEQAIARIFREAEQDGSVLVMDEADSLLASRLGARNSWEVTQVNELLTQMEVFQGVFVASTNLMDRLDEAVLRRFDFKVRMDWLTAEQARRCLDGVLHQLGWQAAPGGDVVRRRVGQLGKLTPGDFENVMRQVRIGSLIETPEQFVEALAAEVAVKGASGGGPIGFLRVA